MAIGYVIKFILLVLAQVVIFNNIVLFNVAVPEVFIYLIVAMPITWNTNVSMIIGFVAGLIIDIFSNTPGVNALACTTLAFARKPIFHLYVQRDEDLGGMSPSRQTIGDESYMKYLVTMTLAYCALVFTVEAFQLFYPLRLLLRIICSTAFTFILIYALDSVLTRRRNEKRL